MTYVMNAIISFIISSQLDFYVNSDYLIGALIAIFILGYLVYTLIKPEKF